MNIRGSRLVAMAQEARRPTRWWLTWIGVTAVLVLVRPPALVIGNAVLGDPGRADVLFPYVDAFGALAVLLALFLWVRLKERRAFTTVGLRPGRDARRLLVGFVVGGGLVGLGVLLALALGVVAPDLSPHTHTGAEAVLPLLPLVLLSLLQGISQEAITRGYLLPVTLRRLPVWVAVGATSALVAVLHSLNPVTLVNAFLFALFASLVALQQGSVWLIAGIQGGWSFFQINVFGLPVGGIPDPDALWSFGPTPDSPADLSGGPFGLDAGLLITAILAMACVVAFVRLRRAGRVASDPAPIAAAPRPTPRKEQPHVTSNV